MSEGALRGARRLAPSIDLSILQGLVALAPYNGARVDLILALSSQSHCQLRQSRPRKTKGCFPSVHIMLCRPLRQSAFGIADRLDDSADEDTAAKDRSLETLLAPLGCGYDCEAHLMRIERVGDLVVAVSFACRAMSTYRLQAWLSRSGSRSSLQALPSRTSRFIASGELRAGARTGNGQRAGKALR